MSLFGDPIPAHRRVVVPLEATKSDDGKVRFDLLPVAALTEVATALTHGAGKYADYNYRGLARTRILAAALRHLFAWAGGEDEDPESGLSHLAHAGASVLMLRDCELHRTGRDDRQEAVA